MRQALARLLFAIALLAMPQLVHAAAQGDGLLGTYYDQDGQQRQYFTGNTVTRIDPVINFDWGGGAPAPGIGADDFSVRWTGEIEMPAWGGGNNPRTVRFRTRTDDGIRVYVDGTLVIDNWTDHGPTFDTGSINARRGQRFPIVIEFYERGGGAVMQLEWDLPGGGTNWETVPQAYLYSMQPPQIVSVRTGSSAGNLCGDLQVLDVTFDQPLDAAEAEDNNNYTIPGGPNVGTATLSADARTVTLLLDAPLIEGQAYTLEVANVQTPAGIVISPNPAIAPFTALSGIQQAGLVGTYYDQDGVAGAFFTGTATRRVDSLIDFDWGTGAPPGTTAGNDNFSVRWEGFVDVPANVYIEFQVFADDGALLYVDDTLVVNTNNSNTSGAQWFFPTGRHSIRLEYAEATGAANVQLRWTICPDFSCFFGGVLIDEVIPAASLFHCTDPYVLDHFGISVGTGTASTCAAQDVGITARNASNFVLSGWVGDIAITTSSNHGDWNGDATAPPQGTLDNGAADDGAAGYAFSPADGGAVALELTNTHADDLSITVTDTLSGVTSTSGAISFRDNAFVISATDPLGDEAVAGRPHLIEAAMWRRDTATGNCSIASAYDGTKTLKAWIDRDAADPNGASPAASNGTTSVVLPASPPAANNLDLGFTNGVANFTLLAGDVGKYALALLDDTRTFASGVDIGGTSNTITVRPFGLSFRDITANGGATANPAGWAANDGVFAAAGADFSVTLAAVAWEAADDADNNGLPDGHADADPANDADLSNNALTTSFAGDISTGFRALAPAGGTMGSLDNLDFPAALFAAGSATIANVRYREVGSIILEASHDTYLGTPGVSVASASPPIGRFVPHHFEVTPVVPGCGTFTYSGQPFSVAVTAMNAFGEITTNYSGSTGWAKIVTLEDASGSLAGSFTNNAIDFSDFSNGDTCTGGDGNCAGSGTTLIDDVVFTFAVAETPAVTLAIRATDTDGASSENHTEAATPVRSGRARLADVTTSSMANAEQPFLAEWWQEVSPGVYAWRTNTEDVCTPGVMGTADFSLSGYTDNLAAGETVPVAFSMTAGSGRLTLSAPGAGNEGNVDVTASVPGWLRFDWGGAGAENPAATVSFQGLFQSEEGFIDRREVIP